jgi:hypothetical protein
MIVRDYIAQLKETKQGKPAQIKEALEIYIDLWESVVKNGTVSEDEEIDAALSKLEKAGGLYQAAG